MGLLERMMEQNITVRTLIYYLAAQSAASLISSSTLDRAHLH